MDRIRVGSHGVPLLLRRVGRETLYLLRWLGWALLTAGSTASCCSFGAFAPYGAWRTPCPRRSTPPCWSRPQRTTAPDVGTRVVDEAARGIREIERYLAAACGETQLTDPDDRGFTGGAG